MSRYWKAGKRVCDILMDYNARVSIEELEAVLGCRPNFVIHYKGDDIVLETPDDVFLQNCSPISQGQFFQVLE